MWGVSVDSLIPGEQPALLTQAYVLAEREKGLTIARLADEVGWRVRRLLGSPDDGPILRIVRRS